MLSVSKGQDISLGKEEHININKWGDCPGSGRVSNDCLCVFVGGHLLWGRRNT